MGGLDIHLSGEEFARLFPFHVAVDPGLRIVQVGPSLQRAYPQLRAGAPFGAHMRIKRPHIDLSFEAIGGQQRMLFIIEMLAGGLVLRGQMMRLTHVDQIVFLGSPWITSIKQLGQSGLALADFAIHDSIGDLLFLFQAQQTALHETEQLAARLAERQAMLQRANQQLEERISQIEQAHATLDTSNSRLTTLIESLQSGVLVEDQHGRVVLANQAFCDIFALPVPPAALVGADCEKMAEGAMPFFRDPDQFIASIADRLRERRLVVAEELRLVDGRTLERDYVPIWRGQVYSGHLWQYRDISEHKGVEAALSRARDEALTSSRLKSDFLAVVSHEIRTPMNGVIGMSELLLGTDLDHDQREYATTIGGAAQALLTIINDILDYSKIEAGKLTLDLAPMAPRDLVEGITSLIGPQAAAKGLTMVSRIAPDVPARVVADIGRLRQVLLNLIGNAIKFTHVGEVSIAMDLEHIVGGEGAAVLRMTVSDTGIGIAKADCAQLFQPFRQVDGTVTRRYGGTGLGLAICKSLVELMGGAIGCESVEGAGSSFWFTIRAGLAEEPGAAPMAPAPAPQVTSLAPPHARLLLVEDTPMNQKLVLHQLARLGYSADVAANGREACDMVARDPARYALVLMDCQMPEMDGYAATEAIRALEHSQGSRLPIIAVTASAMQSEREACLRAGMDDVLLKPLSLAALASALGQWLPADAASGADSPLDKGIFGELTALFRGSPDELASLVDEYRDKGRDSLDAIAAALAHGDSATLRRAAHALKGSSLLIGATALAGLCGQLEARASDLGGAAALAAEAGQAFERVRRALAPYAPGPIPAPR